MAGISLNFTIMEQVQLRIQVTKKHRSKGTTTKRNFHNQQNVKCVYCIVRKVAKDTLTKPIDDKSDTADRNVLVVKEKGRPTSHSGR
jgi:hypothetical protein